MIKIDVTRLEIALYFSKMLIALYKTFICIGAHLSPPPGGGRERGGAGEPVPIQSPCSQSKHGRFRLRKKNLSLEDVLI